PLEDDDFLLAQRQRYLDANTPERQAERYRARMEQVEQERAQEKYLAEAQGFVNDVLGPAMDKIKAQYPAVTDEELQGKWYAATQGITRNGTIPKAAWQQARAKYETEARAAKAEARKVKRLVAKTVRPSTQRSAPSVTKRKPIVSADDAIKDIVQNDVAELVRNMTGG